MKAGRGLSNATEKPFTYVLPTTSNVGWFGETSPVVHYIHKVVHVRLDPPKSTFSGDCIPSPRGCWPLIIFTHAKDWPRLASAHHKPGRVLNI